MDYSNLAALAAVGAGASIAYVGARNIVPLYRNTMKTRLNAASSQTKSSLRAAAQNSNVIGFYADAIRHGDGSYTKGYILEPCTTIFGYENKLLDQIQGWASLFRSGKPQGTIIQFRYSSVPDPGQVILQHLQDLEGKQTHTDAAELHILGLSQTLDQCVAGRYRLPRITVWVKVPVKAKQSNTLLDDIKLGWQAGGWRGAQKAMSQTDKIVARIAEDEHQAYNEARRIFRQFEQGCPIKCRALTQQEMWDAVYLSHRQDATVSPSVPPVGIDVRDYLCAETISAKGWYAMHGSVPVVMLSMLAPPQPFVEAEIMRKLTANGNLNFGRWTLIHEFLTIDQKKAQNKLLHRYRQAERSAMTAMGKERKDKKAESVIRELDQITRDVASAREAMIGMRSYCVLYGPSCKTPDVLKAALSKLEEDTEFMITTFKTLQGADIRREEPAALAALYPKTLIGEYTAQPNGRDIEEVCGSLAALVPQEVEWRGSKHAHTILTTPTNSLVGLNFFDPTVTPMPLGVFIAASGNGKSVALSKIITDFLATMPEGKVKALDYREGFASLTEVLGGRHLKLDPDTKRTINIWDCPELKLGLDIDPAQKSIVVEFYMHLAGLKEDNTDAKNILNEIVSAMYTQYQNMNKDAGDIKYEPTLSHLVDNLRTWKFETQAMRDQCERLRIALGNYCGEYFLDSPTHPDFAAESPFDVYEMGTLKEFSREIQQALAYAIIARVLRSIGKPRPDGSFPPTLLVGDEMNEIRKNFPNVMGVFEKAARTGRKENTITLIAGQSYQDIGDIPAFSTNAGFRLVGKQSSTFELLSEHAQLSPTAEAAINSIRNVIGSHAQFVGIFSSGATQVVEMLQIELSPVELWINTSDPRERTARARVRALKPHWSIKDCIGYLATNYPRGLVFAGLTAIDEETLARVP